MSTRSTPIFKTQMLLNTCLSSMTNMLLSPPTSSLTILFLCKPHYVDCFIKELGIDNSPGNPAFIPTTITKEEILDNHMSVLCSFAISTKDKELDLPSLLDS